MKVTITENAKPEITYPYLAIHRDDLQRTDAMIILFTSKNRGILVHDNDLSVDRKFAVDEWEESVFVKYTGYVILENDSGILT